MFKDAPLSTLIDVPLSHIPQSVYRTALNWLEMPPVKLEDFSAFVLRAFDQILVDLEAQQGGGDDSKSQASSPGDLCLGLYSWAHNLLPLVSVSSKKRCCIPQSMDLVLQFVEEILSRPRARTILVDGALRESDPLIPVSSFEILVRLTFPAPSARVKSTERVEAIYSLLKDVTLSPFMPGESNALKQMFTFSLRSARRGIVTGNPVLAEEATSIAIWCCVTESVDCFEHWDILYRENLEASVALLKSLLGQRRVFLRLSTSPSDSLTVNQTMESFRRKNKRAIAEGGANCSLYREADKYCTLISKSLSRGSGGFKLTPITAVVLAAAGAAAGAAAALVVLA
ncbi:hypothetical protein Bca52824_084126 [Brassica carinata]|uniref:Uncharacterized protein n=1 Tax=Brassica carinata TaxID=52824 RepID=A0A8X7PMT6_BRACI|nr:hypothetical protein Bca52824_084126 [Brassica carinata]